MPPPMPLSGALARYSCGSQSGSAKSSAKRGRMASHASSGDAAEPSDDRTAAMNPRTSGVSSTYSSLLTERVSRHSARNFKTDA